MDDIKEEVEILIKYDGYLQRQEQQVETADISVLMVMLKGEGGVNYLFLVKEFTL